MKLSHKLFLVYLLFTLAILLPIGIFIYFSAIGLVEKQIQSSLNEKAKHMLDKMDRVLFERYSDMQTIVSDPVFTKKILILPKLHKNLSLTVTNVKFIFLCLFTTKIAFEKRIR